MALVISAFPNQSANGGKTRSAARWDPRERNELAQLVSLRVRNPGPSFVLTAQTRVMNMCDATSDQLADLFREWSEGSPSASRQLMALVYDQLRALAARQLRSERRDHTLRPTALVHEAFLRMLNQKGVCENRAHFFALAAQAMRRVLLDYSRARRAAKRSGGCQSVSLEEDVALADGPELDVVALNAALEQLQAIDGGKARLVELRFFAGLSVEEVAQALGISASTVAREWRLAKAWLYRRLQDDGFHQERSQRRAG